MKEGDKDKEGEASSRRTAEVERRKTGGHQREMKKEVRGVRQDPGPQRVLSEKWQETEPRGPKGARELGQKRR